MFCLWFPNRLIHPQSTVLAAAHISSHVYQLARGLDVVADVVPSRNPRGKVCYLCWLDCPPKRLTHDLCFRGFGSRKYSVGKKTGHTGSTIMAESCFKHTQSFIFLVSLISTAIITSLLLLCHPLLGFNYVPAGSFAISGAM